MNNTKTLFRVTATRGRFVHSVMFFEASDMATARSLAAMQTPASCRLHVEAA